jgi:hypothetical protein
MATSARIVTERSAEHRFYAGMTLAIFAVVYVGFARSFFLRPWFPEFPVPPERFFLLHGLVFAAWVVLLLVQPLLVAAGRSDLHRRLGRLGVILALGVVLSGVYGALLAAGRPGGFIGVPVPPAAFLAVPLFDILMFAAFVTLALRAVRQPQAHKRWMLLAAMTMLTAAFARWPGDPLGRIGILGVFALGDAFLLPLAAWDLRSRGRLHPVTLWGGLALVASQPLRLAISGTAAWGAFAGSLIGLLA